MKSIALTHGIVAAVLLGAAATGIGAQSGNTQSGTNTQSTGTQRTTTQRSSTASSNEREFVQTMLMANMAEIQLGQLATSKAANPEVKAFGQMMVDDHTKANQQLMPIAQRLGVTQPSQLDAKHKALADKLAKASGAQFDKEFMEAMVEGHQDVLKTARTMASAKSSTGSGATGTSGTSGTQSGTAGTAGSSSSAGAGMSPEAYAAATAPTIEHHLERAQQIEKNLGK
jgi:putative membrane protein